MEKIYQKNLNSLKAQNPKLGEEVAKITTNANFDVFFDETRLNALDLRINQHVYNSDDYIKMVDDFLVENSRKKVIFAYGFGLGVFYKLLFEKGDFNHIVVFEPDLELIYIAFHLADFTKEIDSDRLFFMEPFNYDEYKIYTLCGFSTIKPYLLSYSLYIHSDYYGKFSENIIQTNKDMAHFIKLVVTMHGNAPQDNLIGMQNTILNIEDIIKNMTLRDFITKNRYKNKSAIIASTGPSLAKQIPLLKKYQDNICIFCPDASYPILMREGIVPDVVCSLERVEATSEFYKDSDKNTTDNNTVFVLTNMVHQQTIKNLSTKNICLVFKGLDFEVMLNLVNYGYVGGGQSASILAAEIANSLGFKNICLIGQDLAYGEDGTTHSKGHIFTENEWDINKYEYILTTAYGGEKQVKTSKTWESFKNQLERLFSDIHNKDINYFNATEGGARINNTTEIPFSEFLDKYATQKKQKMIITKTTEWERSHSKEVYTKSIENFYQNIKNYTEDLDKISLEFENINNELKSYKKEIDFSNLEEEINSLIRKEESDFYFQFDLNRFYRDVKNELLEKIEDNTNKFLNLLKDKDFRLHFAGLCSHRLYQCELKINQILSYPQNTKEQKQNNILLLNEYVKYYSMEFCGYARIMYELLLDEKERLEKEENAK